jgi:hypothetical protein
MNGLRSFADGSKPECLRRASTGRLDPRSGSLAQHTERLSAFDFTPDSAVGLFESSFMRT